jgi:muconolactone delta-isomerase
MVNLKHGPDTCAAAHPEQGEMARNAMDRMEAASKKHQVTVQGGWVDAPAHEFYILADAPNAHAINNLMTDLQFFLWNTVDIHPVVTLEEAMKLSK